MAESDRAWRGGTRKMEAGKKSDMPESACPNCGARGWCGHGNRKKELWM